MKTKILPLILASILMIFIAPQCTIETDPCEGVNCLNGGDCDEGNCYCPDWYEGSNCGTQSRSTYYGNYSGLRTYDNALAYTEAPYTVISVGASSLGVSSIKVGSSLEAQLTFPTQGNFTIGPQPYGLMSVEGGYGSVSGNRLQFILQGYLDGYYTIVTYDGYR